uniref:F-box domain-containing protein n=1 Tax=Ditylum brightwellii TaxID=49249 RepID=A0A7S4SUV1_9STRA
MSLKNSERNMLEVIGDQSLLGDVCASLSLPDIVCLSSTSRTVRDAIRDHISENEIAAARHMVMDYGFCLDHLDLLHEYLAKHKIPIKTTEKEKAEGDSGWDNQSLTWGVQAENWDRKVEKYHSAAERKYRGLCQWVISWHATCMDASRQRALIVRPGETIQCDLTFHSSCLSNTCIIQMQVAIDSIDVAGGNRGDVAEVCCSSNSSRTKFSLTAPEEPGLYMIRYMSSWHYSFRQAANEQWPKPLARTPDEFAGSFIAWLRVDPTAAKKPAGNCV